jgi:methionyl-tRNA formyltransferase
MRILLLTQSDRLYLPTSLAVVCRSLSCELVAVVSAPAMSTHGTFMRGVTRHFRLFGVSGTVIIVRRILAATFRGLFPVRSSGPFNSLRAVCNAFNVPFHVVRKVNGPGFQALVDRYGPELLVSLSCPQIIRKSVRQRFPMGCINVHGAPLPRYRGLMPAFWSLRFEEPATAVSVHVLDDKLDNGDILLQRAVNISPEDTWDSLVRKTKAAAAEALIEAIEAIRAGTVDHKPNLEAEATYFSFPTSVDRQAFLAAGRRFF